MSDETGPYATLGDHSAARTLLDSLPHIVYQAEASGRVTFVNRRWVDYTGLSIEETLAGAFHRAVDPDDMSANRVAWQLASGRGVPFEAEERLRGRDGVYRWFKVTALPTFSEGEVTGWVGTVIDIHQTRVAAERTRALHTLAVSLATTAGSDEVLAALAGGTARATGAHRVLVCVLQPDRRTIATVKAEGVSDELLKDWLTFSVDSPTSVSKVVRTGEAVFFANRTERDNVYGDTAAAADRFGIVAVAAVPVRIDGQTLACLYMGFPSEQAFDREQRAFLEAVAAEAARALARTRNVEELVLARDQAEAASALLEGILSNLPVGWCFFDRDLRYLRVNRALAAMNGLPVEEHIGRSPWEIVPAVRDAVEPLLQRVVETRQPVVGVRLSANSPTQAGTARHFDASYYPVLGHSGEVAGVGAITVEVTEREAVQAAINEQRERLVLALDAGRLAAWDWDLSTDVRSWEGMYRELLGLPDAGPTMPMSEFMRLVLEEDRAALLAAYQRAIGDGEPYEHEYRIVHPDGAVHWVLGRGRCDYDERGRAVRLRGTLQEVTDRRRAQEALARLNSELEQRVRERTAQLEERNAEAETFLYTASHDLRTPLVSLFGMTEVAINALERGDQAEARFALDRVLQNTTRMDSLLNDLLTFSRVGRSPEASKSLDLGAVVATVLADLAAQVRAAGANVELRDDWPLVVLPPTELAQVLANLLSNAVKFAGRGSGEALVRVSARREGDRVLLSVEDNGRGIPTPYRERVFGLFQKLDATVPGTGVGLAIVKRIVEQHGGRAWVEDSPLGGACLVVTLPAERRAADPEAYSGPERRPQG